MKVSYHCADFGGHSTGCIFQQWIAFQWHVTRFPNESFHWLTLQCTTDIFPSALVKSCRWENNYHHHRHHLSLNRGGRWGTTADFATSFLHFFPCSSLPSGTCRTPGLSIPRCCLPTSSSVCLVFFPLSLCLAKWFWPDLMNERHDQYHCSLRLFTIARSSCGLLDLGTDVLVGSMVFVWDV